MNININSINLSNYEYDKSYYLGVLKDKIDSIIHDYFTTGNRKQRKKPLCPFKIGEFKRNNHQKIENIINKIINIYDNKLCQIKELSLNLIYTTYLHELFDTSVAIVFLVF
jgi:hypothetical protein